MTDAINPYDGLEPLRIGEWGIVSFQYTKMAWCYNSVSNVHGQFSLFTPDYLHLIIYT